MASPAIEQRGNVLPPGQRNQPPGQVGYAQFGQYAPVSAPFGQQSMAPGNGMYAQGNPYYVPPSTSGKPGMPPGNWQMPGANGGAPPYGNNFPQPNNMEPGGKKARKKKRRFPIWARVVVGILTFFLILTSVGAYYYYVDFAPAVGNDTGQTVHRLSGDVPNSGRGSSNSSGILSGGRFNILLLGSDDDYKSTVINGGVLAQTDIVVSVDPASHTVSMLSIPRDSWVDIPGHGMGKLDQAYLLGGGGANGAALSMATIHQDFGIYIDHYAWVGLSGFVKVIDTVGGIDINVLHPITDDAYPDDTGKGAIDPYAVKRLYIAPGPQHLSGLQALEYVRSRHADLVGDFGRSVRQQQVLSQLKYKLESPSIINELPQLAQDLNGYVKTDMQLTDVFNLMYFAKGLTSQQIGSHTLGPPYSTTANIDTSAGQQSVVVLDCAKVIPLIAQLFAIGNQATCQQVSMNAPLAIPITPSAKTTHASSPQANTPAVPEASGSPVQAVQTSALSLTGAFTDFLGIHSLLDLLLLAVFESPIALQV